MSMVRQIEKVLAGYEEKNDVLFSVSSSIGGGIFFLKEEKKIGR